MVNNKPDSFEIRKRNNKCNLRLIQIDRGEEKLIYIRNKQ